MGREVRRVPKDWIPPSKPHYDQDYESAVAEWKTGYEKWKTEPKDDCEYWEWDGGPPDHEYYRPKWTDEERTHLMMYETTSEGTAISPAFETPEELARWLVDNNASSFAGMGATYKQWLSVCRGGYAPSAVYSEKTGLISGVAASFD